MEFSVEPHKKNTRFRNRKHLLCFLLFRFQFFSCKHEGYENYPWPQSWGADVNLYKGLPDCEVIPPDGNGVPVSYLETLFFIFLENNRQIYVRWIGTKKGTIAIYCGNDESRRGNPQFRWKLFFIRSARQFSFHHFFWMSSAGSVVDILCGLSPK